MWEKWSGLPVTISSSLEAINFTSLSNETTKEEVTLEMQQFNSSSTDMDSVFWMHNFFIAPENPLYQFSEITTGPFRLLTGLDTENLVSLRHH